ncbi:MAG TPA: hypothetical protein G4O03_00125 [Dehalococcoidia bacterium]|jgi:hypothetical protein|nr:hypothetical protein [Dehalococcoidia bacterium]
MKELRLALRCPACGSEQIVTEGEGRRCRQCGHAGRGFLFEHLVTREGKARYAWRHQGWCLLSAEAGEDRLINLGVPEEGLRKYFTTFRRRYAHKGVSGAVDATINFYTATYRQLRGEMPSPEQIQQLRMMLTS